MNLFKKLFKSKKTSAQVGRELWVMCNFVTDDQIVTLYPDLRNDLGVDIDEDKYILEKNEILVVNLWAITESLAGGVWDDAIRNMWNIYIMSSAGSGNDDVQEYCMLRCEQYRSLFDRKNRHFDMLALQILHNIYNDGKPDKKHINVLVNYKIIATIFHVMEMACNLVSRISIKG